MGLLRGAVARAGPSGMRGAARVAIVAMTLGPVACGGAGRIPPPLRPQPIAYIDTLPIPEPERRDPLEVYYLLQDAVGGEVSNAISLRKAAGKRHESLNVTSFDDVVNSAWFEHRNGVRRMTPEEIGRGPTRSEGPDTSAVITVVKAKLQGISPGFDVRDARGDLFVVKFDPRGFPHLGSAASVISNRLLHAAGYHVPEDYVFRFHREQLEVDAAEAATVTDPDFTERALTAQAVDEVLRRTDHLSDGSYLAVASKYVPGPPKGPFHFDGVRKDDPNDHYRHEHRRELRGLYVISSWLNHVDMRFANTMDAYVPPGYLRHYLIDFAATLGSGTIRPHQPREGMEYNYDLWPTMARIFSLGFYKQGWEDREWEVIDPSIGWMDAETFDPGRWKANWPNRAFSNMTLRDAYWGAKLVGSFSREQIRAAVDAGQLPTAFAADTLTAILAYRRDRIVEHWYSLVSPVENPVVEPAGEGGPEPGRGRMTTSGFVVGFDDLGIRDGPWTGEETTYEWTLEHAALGRRWRGRANASRSVRQRVVVAPVGPKDTTGNPDRPVREGEAIATLRLGAVRQGGDGRPAVVYLRWIPEADAYSVVGLEH